MAIPALPTPGTKPLAPAVILPRYFRPLRDPRRAHRRQHLAGSRHLGAAAPEVAAALPGAAERHPLARHLRARLRPDRPRGLPGLLPLLGRRRLRGRAAAPRGHRWQDAPPLGLGPAGA